MLHPVVSLVFAPATMVAVSTYLLLASILLLVAGVEAMANRTAVCALYLLTASIFLLLVQHVVHRRSRDDDRSEIRWGAWKR